MTKAEAQETALKVKAPLLPEFVLLSLKLAGVDDPHHLRFYTEREVRSWSWIAIGFAEIEAFMAEEGLTFRTPGYSVFAKFTPSIMDKLKKACVSHESHFFEMDPAELEAIISDPTDLDIVLTILAEENIQLGHEEQQQKKRSRRARGGVRARQSREKRTLQ